MKHSLRGKTVNTFELTEKEILENTEIINFIRKIGVGLKGHLPEKFHPKIIITE